MCLGIPMAMKAFGASTGDIARTAISPAYGLGHALLRKKKPNVGATVATAVGG